MSFGARIRYLRENKGLRQEDIGKMFNVGKSAVSQWENDIRTPEIAIIKQIADYFGVSFNYLFARDDDRTNIVMILNKLPILGTIRAGLPILAEENYDGYLDVPESIRADYALRVIGDSMIGAGILDGDYAICRESYEPQTGQIIVALRDEGSISEATLKFYFNGNGEPKLKPANPTYPEFNYKEGYRCAGHMVALIREDSPGYQVYKDYLAVNDSEEWTDVIELATEAGIKANQVKEILAVQVEIAKKLKNS